MLQKFSSIKFILMILLINNLFEFIGTYSIFVYLQIYWVSIVFPLALDSSGIILRQNKLNIWIVKPFLKSVDILKLKHIQDWSPGKFTSDRGKITGGLLLNVTSKTTECTLHIYLTTLLNFPRIYLNCEQNQNSYKNTTPVDSLFTVRRAT